MIRLRILFGLLMILALAALFWGDSYLAESRNVTWAPLFFGIIVLLAAGGSLELTMMMGRRNWRVRWWLTVPATVALVILAAVGAARGGPLYWAGGPVLIGPTMWVLGLTLLLVLLLEVARAARTGEFESALGAICGTLLVPLYVGVLLVVVSIRFMLDPPGLQGLLLFLIVCKLSDMGAYFAGKLLGRHKLVPRLSPGKTWEGLAGGLLLSLAGSLALTAWGLAGLSLWQAVVFGLAVAAASVVGDLAESLLKRSCGRKDSGNVLPEFGGVLDVVDSILVSAPVAYGLLVWMAG